MSRSDDPPAVTLLGVETASVPWAARFYTDAMGLVPVAYDDRAVAFDVGGSRLVCRRPRSVPRGGVHVHYALTAPAVEFPRWQARFPDAETVAFGDARSIYPFDPDGHCPEVAAFGDRGTGLTGVFEVVLEVTDLAVSERAYRALGFDPVDRGDERRRVRLRGPENVDASFDLELWEPQIGLAGARGGLHVDLGIRIADPLALAEAAFGDLDRAVIDRNASGRVDDRPGLAPPGCDATANVVVRDPDGHRLRLVPSA